MNWNAVVAIVRKDLKVVFQNKGVSIPLIVAPILILVVFLPGAAALAPRLGYLDSPDITWLDKVIEVMPAGFEAAMAGYDMAQMFVTILLVYGGAALYPLLPALGIAWGGFLLYTVMANLAAWPVMGRLFFPTTVWVILAVWVAPAIAALGLGAMILVSSRARTFQEANQLSAVVILPGFMLFGTLLIGVMAFNAWLAVLLGLLIWAIDAALLWFGRRGFQRDKLAVQV